MLYFYAKTENGKYPFTTNGNTHTLPISVLEKNKTIDVCCDELDACVGEDGFYLIPGSISTPGSALINFTDKNDGELNITHPLISAFGVRNKNGTFAVIIERSYQACYYVSLSDKKYTLRIKYNLVNQPIDSQLKYTVITMDSDSDYNDIANAIREYKLAVGEMRPLKEKCKERPILDYARKHPLIRIRMGWKPAPPEILCQTLENEPEMHTACTFARVRDIADELNRQGVEGAEISLVGWNQKGHDGRWPDIFPVEQALGGEAELVKTIEHCKKLGYIVSCHTNTLDHYEIASTFNKDDLAYDSEGGTYTSGDWSGGRSYRACHTVQWKYAQKDLPRVAELGFTGLHYIDVLSIVDPSTCMSEKHPCSYRQCVDYIRKIMALSRNLMGGFASEGCMDFSYSDLDFSLYNSFKNMFDKPSGIIDEYIPLAEMVCHGAILYNPSAETINHTIKGSNNEIMQALYGGRPSFYYYSKFRTTTNWMGDTDLICDTDEDLTESVMAIKKSCDAYSEFEALQLQYMVYYRDYKNGIRVVGYDSGDKVIANLNDCDKEFESTVIPAHSYILKKSD